MNDFVNLVLSIAGSQVGVRETKGVRNRGPEIDGYCRDIGWPVEGLHPEKGADPWCAIFVSAMVKRACDQMGLKVPIHLTAGVFTLDEKAPPECHTKVPARGCIFIMEEHRHTGLVETVAVDGQLLTVEGNTDGGGSPEGDGVYRRLRDPGFTGRQMIGYLDLNLLTLESL